MSLPKTEQPQGSQTIKNSGSIIIQNWNTKSNVPKELEEYVNLPIIADKGKLKSNSLKVNLLPPIEKPIERPIEKSIEKIFYQRD